jgi:parallel beta-helix repeat protein
VVPLVMRAAVALRRLAMISAAIVAVMPAWTSPSTASDYYVDGRTGSDSNQGTSDAPFRSFGRAISMLAPGDKLTVAGGRYTEPLMLTKSGTAQQPIIVIGEGTPLIETAADAIVITGSYVELSGFEAHSLGGGSAIAVGKRNHHVRISDNVARDSGCGGIALLQTDYVTIEHNRVFGNSRRAPWQCSGISIYQAMNFDHAEGVHNVIRRNLVYDNMDMVVDNKISNSGGKTTDGNGIIFDDSRHSQGDISDPAYDGLTLIENNIVFDNGGRGIHIFSSDHVVVRNNTCYHDVKDPNLAGRQTQAEFMAVDASDVRFVNNIAAPRDDTVFGFLTAQAKDIVWDFNLIVGGASPAGSLPSGVEARKGWGAHNIVEADGDVFVAPSVDPQAADFHLRPGSRAIGAGSSSDSPRDDFSGASRPSTEPIDLGALQSNRAAP